MRLRPHRVVVDEFFLIVLFPFWGLTFALPGRT